MYDTIIIGAGMSGLAAGIRLAHYDRRVCILERHSTIGGLNSFYRPRRPDLRRRTARDHQLRAQGARGKVRWPGCCGSCGWPGTNSRWRRSSARPSCFPACSCEFSNDFEPAGVGGRAGSFPRQIRTTSAGWSPALADYDQFGRAGGQPLGPRGASAASSTIRCWSRCSFARCCSTAAAAGARHGFRPVQHPFPLDLPGRAGPAAGRRAADPQETGAQVQGAGRRIAAAVRREPDPRQRRGRSSSVVLDDGTELEARQVLSSAGWPETMRLCGDAPAPPRAAAPAGSRFVESISSSTASRGLGYDRTMVFFNDSQKFRYDKPDELADVRSGVICSPNNFVYGEPLAEGVMRISALANYDRWAGLDADAYQLAKAALVRSNGRFGACGSCPISARGDRDRHVHAATIRRFTGHEKGPIYGTAEKRYDGTTHLKTSSSAATIRGWWASSARILSGISIANRYSAANVITPCRLPAKTPARIRRGRDRRRTGRDDRRQYAGPGRPFGAAFGATLPSWAAWPPGFAGPAAISSTSRCTAFRWA